MPVVMNLKLLSRRMEVNPKNKTMEETSRVNAAKMDILNKMEMALKSNPCNSNLSINLD